MRQTLRTLIITAFLLPSGIALAEAPESANICATCHGADGNSTAPIYPNLAGQHASYTLEQLKAIKNGTRSVPEMTAFVTNLSVEQMEEIAAWYATLEPRIGAADEALLERGQKLYRGGDAESGLPACMACHGPNGAGNPGAVYPALSGQNAAYTEKQLNAYRDGTRTAAKASQMQTIANRLSPDDIKALSSYIQGLH